MLILTVSKTAVLGRSNGAPEEACSNGLVPSHISPANSATGEVPFSVDISDIGDSYTPEETYTSKCCIYKHIKLLMLLSGIFQMNILMNKQLCCLNNVCNQTIYLWLHVQKHQIIVSLLGNHSDVNFGISHNLQ